MYAWAIERIPPDKIEEWMHMLNQPLSGREAKPTEDELEADGASFMAAMQTLKGA